jgi:hypothetical protein
MPPRVHAAGPRYGLAQRQTVVRGGSTLLSMVGADGWQGMAQPHQWRGVQWLGLIDGTTSLHFCTHRLSTCGDSEGV